jgi:hypothetical protein
MMEKNKIAAFPFLALPALLLSGRAQFGFGAVVTKC